MSHDAIFQSIVSFLTDDPDKMDLSGFKQWMFFRSFFLRVDEVLLKQLERWVQAQIIDAIKGPSALFKIATWLCYLPYMLPKAGTVIQVPMKCHKWELVEYRIRYLQMQLGYRVMILDAKDHPSWMIFMGTTYMACPGFLFTILSDLFPKAIGWLGSFSKESVHACLEEKKQWYVAGMSLGAQFVHFLTDHDHVKQRFFIKPALSYTPNKAKVGDVYIVNQNDPVSRFGRIDDNAEVWTVMSQDADDFFLSHAQAKIARFPVRKQSVLPMKQLWFWYYILRGVLFLICLPLLCIGLLLRLRR